MCGGMKSRRKVAKKRDGYGNWRRKPHKTASVESRELLAAPCRSVLDECRGRAIRGSDSMASGQLRTCGRIQVKRSELR